MPDRMAGVCVWECVCVFLPVSIILCGGFFHFPIKPNCFILACDVPSVSLPLFAFFGPFPVFAPPLRNDTDFLIFTISSSVLLTPRRFHVSHFPFTDQLISSAPALIAPPVPFRLALKGSAGSSFLD